MNCIKKAGLLWSLFVVTLFPHHVRADDSATNSSETTVNAVGVGGPSTAELNFAPQSESTSRGSLFYPGPAAYVPSMPGNFGPQGAPTAVVGYATLQRVYSILNTVVMNGSEIDPSAETETFQCGRHVICRFNPWPTYYVTKIPDYLKSGKNKRPTLYLGRPEMIAGKRAVALGTIEVESIATPHMVPGVDEIRTGAMHLASRISGFEQTALLEVPKTTGVTYAIEVDGHASGISIGGAGVNNGGTGSGGGIIGYADTKGGNRPVFGVSTTYGVFAINGDYGKYTISDERWDIFRQEVYGVPSSIETQAEPVSRDTAIKATQK